MSGESYRAAYDAWREALQSANLSFLSQELVQALVQDISPQVGEAIKETLSTVSSQLTRPSVIYRPRLRQYVTSKLWCAEYTVEGGTLVQGHGITPAKAMEHFDAVWNTRTEANMNILTCEKCESLNDCNLYKQCRKTGQHFTTST